MIRYDRNSIERKRCHIRDLKHRLVEASVIPGDIVLAAVDLAKTEKQRALRKVMESIHREQEFSEPMRNTPRKRRFDHALRGYWDRFPVSPEPYAEKVERHFRSKGFYSKSASYRIAQTLDGYVETGDEATRSGQCGSGTGAPAGLDDGRHRTDSEGRRFLRKHRDEPLTKGSPPTSRSPSNRPESMMRCSSRTCSIS